MTLNLMVCPHDTANNPDRWFRFVQYFSKKLDIHLQFDISLDFADFHENLDKADIVYANPTDTIMLMDQKGFHVLARPSNMYDEVVFVANPDIAGPTLESLQGVQCASVTSLLPTKIALHVLHTRSIEPAQIVDNDSWTSVISSIWRGDIQYGIVYKDTYDELSEQGKNMVNAFATSDERIAFHNILVGHNALDQQDAIAHILLDMHNDADGKDLLSELRVEQWLSTTQEDIDKIKHILESY